jgi:heme exporter protein A
MSRPGLSESPAPRLLREMTAAREAGCLVRLSLEGVSKRFGRRRVFDGLTVAVDQGEVLVVTGANGSGKSTLMLVIAGLLRPTRGRVVATLNGKPLPAEDRRVWLGMVSPDLTLYPELTGLENLRFFERVRGRVPRDGELNALLERVGLSGRGEDLVRTYSSGMRQRLKYAFALAHAPKVLLLDEPTANLDVSGVSMVEEVIAEQRRRGVLVLATNEPEEVRHGDRRVALGA